MKNRINAIGLSVVATAVLAACGGGGSEPAASTNIVNGVASKGILNGAKVCAYAITASGAQGAQIGTCSTTDSVGNYSINLGAYIGPALFQAIGGTYVDEATGATVPLSSPLNSVISNATGGPARIAVTALTEMAYQNASALPGGLNSANILSATTTVQNNFGVSDIVTTMPVDAFKVPTSATNAQLIYTLALATVAQYQNAAGTNLSTALQNMASCLATPTTSCGTGATSVGTSLSTAQNTFVAKNRAFNGLTGSTGRVAFFGSVTALPSNGTDGTTGSAGATGATGSTGVAGTNGTNGTNGAVGTAGANGATGATGATGSTGVAGTNGTNGTNGAVGASGANGATGPAGPGITWVNVTGTTQQAVSNTGYMANNAAQVTITLPVAPAVGDVIQVNGVGTGGWNIATNSGQSVVTTYISATPLAGLISGLQFQAIELQYVGNNTFTVLNYVGTNPSTLVFPVGYISVGGLIWMPTSSTLYNYPTAYSFCQGSINGLNGWRLPTLAELTTLFNSGEVANSSSWDQSWTIAGVNSSGGYNLVYLSNFTSSIQSISWESLNQGGGNVTCVR